MDTEVLVGRPAWRAAPRRIAWLLFLMMSSHGTICEEQWEKNKDWIECGNIWVSCFLLILYYIPLIMKEVVEFSI